MDLVYRAIGPPPPEGTELLSTLDSVDGLDGTYVTEHGPCLRFVFRPKEDMYSRRRITTLKSPYANEFCNLVKFLEGALDRRLIESEDLAACIAEMVDQEFLVTVSHTEAKHGGVYLHADKVRPVQPGSPRDTAPAESGTNSAS